MHINFRQVCPIKTDRSETHNFGIPSNQNEIFFIHMHAFRNKKFEVVLQKACC